MRKSKDEVERARLMSEYKYELDTQSKMVQAKREARKERDREIALKLKNRGRSFGEIAEDTGLSLEEIAKL